MESRSAEAKRVFGSALDRARIRRKDHQGSFGRVRVGRHVPTRYAHHGYWLHLRPCELCCRRLSAGSSLFANLRELCMDQTTGEGVTWMASDKVVATELGEGLALLNLS